MPDGQRRRRLQPEVGQAQRLLHRVALVRRDRRVARGGELAGGHLPGQVPVDRPAARRGEQVLQLRHELLHLRGIVGVWWLPTRERETERNIRHDVYGTRAAPQVAAAGVALRAKSAGTRRVAARPVGTLCRMRRRGVTVLLGALLTALLSIGVLARAHPVRGARPRADGEHPRHGRRQGGHPGHRPGDLHLRRSAPADHGRRAADGAAALGDRRLVLRRRGGGAARAGLPARASRRSRSSSATPRTSRRRRPAPRPPRCGSWASRCRWWSRRWPRTGRRPAC